MASTIIPFDEIIPGATARFTVVDGVQYLCVFDVIMAMCGKHRHYAAETWRNLSDSFKSEVEVFLRHFKFPGRGQQEQPIIQFQGAIMLIMQLPGEKAKQLRRKAADIITRYYAGDKTLLAEVYANAESQGVINQAARAAVQAVEDDHTRKRKALDIAAQEEAVEMSRIDRHRKTIQLQKDLMEMYALVSPGGQLDDRTRLHFKDIIVNLSSAAAGNYMAITNGEAKSQNAPLTISTIAAELGLRFTTDELKSIGAKVSKLYHAKHGTGPSKHEQPCGGAVRLVCSYTERDRDIVEQALRAHGK
jgi:protein-tyrosine-phosphatase